MGGSSSKNNDDLGALPTQQVVSVGHGTHYAPSGSSAHQAPFHPPPRPAQHTDVQQAKVYAFWDKSSFRLERNGSSKFLWIFVADFTAEVPCELSVQFHCRERLNGNYLQHTPVEQGGPPGFVRSFGAGKHNLRLDGTQAAEIDIKRWPLEVFWKSKSGTKDIIPIVLSLQANGVQLVTHLSLQVERSTSAQGTVLSCTMLRQKAVVNGSEYPMEEVYGLAGVKEHDNDAAGEPCVICLTDPRNTVVLPCQHMCLCEDCAGQLQVGAIVRGEKCPICRGQISGVRVFDVKSAPKQFAAPPLPQEATNQMQVTVPAGSSGGSHLQLTSPSGQQFEVTVPAGLQAGDLFIAQC